MPQSPDVVDRFLSPLAEILENITYIIEVSGYERRTLLLSQKAIFQGSCKRILPKHLQFVGPTLSNEYCNVPLEYYNVKIECIYNQL